MNINNIMIFIKKINKYIYKYDIIYNYQREGFNMTNVNKDLMNFIDETPNAYFCVDNLRKKLIETGFVELYENQNWDNLTDNGKYFVVRNDSSLIAFKMSGKKENIGFNIVSAHTDSPSFSIKPNADMFDGNYVSYRYNTFA